MVRLGFGPLWRGVGLHEKRGVSGYAVNRWSIKRPPNGTKHDRRSTRGIPMPLGKPRAIRESLTPAHETRSERGDGARARGLDSERTTERTGGTRTDANFEKHADEDMTKCNTQANDMATTTNNSRTSGASNPGCYMYLELKYA